MTKSSWGETQILFAPPHMFQATFTVLTMDAYLCVTLTVRAFWPSINLQLLPEQPLNSLKMPKLSSLQTTNKNLYGNICNLQHKNL